MLLKLQFIAHTKDFSGKMLDIYSQYIFLWNHVSLLFMGHRQIQSLTLWMSIELFFFFSGSRLGL